MNNNKDNVSLLYNGLIKKGYTKNDLGDEATFRSKMADEGSRKELYDYVSERGDFRIGDYDTYVSRLNESYASNKGQEDKPYTHEYDKNGKLIGGTAYQAPEPYQYKPEVQQHIAENIPDMFKPKASLMDAPLGIASNADEFTGEKLYARKERANEWAKRPITEFGEAFEQGSEALYQGGKNLVGETANLFSGSQRDYTRAQQQLKELVESGYELNDFEVQKALKDYKDRDFQRKNVEWQKDIASRKAEREGMGFFEGLLHRIQDPSRPKSQYEDTGMFADEVQLQRAYYAIEDALKITNGDVSAAFNLLGEKSAKETWGDKVTREAREEISKQRPTEGFNAWVGGMLPQMVGNVGATAARFTPWGRWLTPLLGYGNMAYLTGSTSGMSMAEARDYAERKGVAANEGKVWRTGMADAAIEYATEKIPFNRYFGKAVDGSKNVVGKWVADAVGKSDAAATEMGDLLSRASKEFGAGIFSGKNVKDYLLDVGTEGLSEFTAEALQTITPMIYQNPEDYPTLKQIWDSGLEGAKGGLFMGAFLGAGNRFANRYQDRKRREKQGEVTFAETKSGVFEVLGVDKDGQIVAQSSDGESVSLANEEVIDQVTVPYEEFKNASMDKAQSDAEIQVETDNAIIDSVTDPSTGEYIEVERWVLDGETGERVPQPGYIVGWIGEAPVFVPEGMENAEENRIVLKPNEWNPETVQRMPAEEVKALNEEMIREEAAAQAERESMYAPEVLNYIPKNGDQVVDVNGQALTITGVTPDGVVYDNGEGRIEQMPIDAWRDLMQAQLEAQEAAQAEASKVEESNQSIVDGPQTKPMNDGTGRVMQPKGVQGNEVVYDIADENGTILEEGSMDAAKYNGVGEEEQSANESANNLQAEAPVIPTKEDGSVDFVAYGKDNSFKMLGEKYGEKMPNKVAVTAKALAEDLKKAQEKLAKAEEALDNAPIGREQKQESARDKAKAELEAVKREADFWAEMDTEIKDAQFRRASMLNPQAETETSNEPMNADEFVAQQLSAGNIVLNKEDYKRETGYGDAEANAMNGGAAKMFGENGMTIQEAGERLMEMDRENGTNFFDQSDSNAGRDALISLLGNVKSRKELNQYIANNRAEQAKKESEGLRNELERSVMDANYASLEDYVLQMEADEMENPFADVNADEILAIFAEAVEEYNNYLNPQENGQGTTEETIEGNGELLSEEQSGDTGGTEVRQESARNGEGAAEESETADEATEVELTQQEGETTLQFAERVAEENRRRSLRKRAEEWSKALSVDVIFVERLEDVDSQVAYFALMDGEKVSGWYEGMTGKVYFYMPNLDDISEVDKTYIHEVVAHKGLKEMLGKERFDELCDKVWDMMPSLEKAKFIRYPGVKGNTRAAADEYIAHLAEKENLTPEEKTMWDRVVKAFRDIFETALNAIIGKVKLTDEDISNLIKASYANLKSGAEGGAVGEGTRFSAKKKRALETASVSRGKHQPTVVSSADGANILNNLDNLAKEYEEKSSQSKTFLGDVSKAIGARKQGSGSQYATFETVNGNVVTIRLADHNATVSNFDNRDENEGISIVVSAKDNNGITNDGDAHIVEYFYDSIDLRRADGKPLAEIVKSIKQSLYSGEYKDTTGLAERQEVNESRLRVVKDKNGKKTLVGLHNISEAKLKKAIKQGGLANPSMAVIDMDKQAHVDYGDITLIAPSSLIDKKTGKNIGTYTADAYTPIYPTVVKKMSDKGGKAFTKALDSVNEIFRSKVRTYFNSYLDNGTMYDALFYWYLSDTGKNPPILDAALPEGYTKEELEKVKAVNPNADAYFELSDNEKKKVVDLYAERFYGSKEEYKNYLNDYVVRMKDVVNDESKPSMVRKRIQKNLKEVEEYGYEYDYVAGYYSRAITLASRQSKPSDFETFRNAHNEVVNNNQMDDFNRWLSEKEAELGVEEKLFAGYDNQGRAKYVANTLENASKLMKKEGRAGATGFGGFNKFISVVAPIAKNLEQINKKKSNLSDQEAYDVFKDKWGDVYHDLAQRLQPGAYKYEDYGYYRLEEIPTVKNPKEYVKKEYGIDLSDEFMQTYNEFISAIKNDFPARYFETKFERPVYLNEFAAAVVPQGTSEDVVSALKDSGLPVEEYERGNNEARMAAVDKVSSEIGGVRFRISEKGKQIKGEVDKFTSKYNSKPVVVVDTQMTEEELHDVFPEVTLEEVKEAVKEGFMGGYSSETGKIYIFVDNQPLDDLDNTMFHENLHGLLEESSEFIDEFYANASDKMPKLKAKLEKLGYKKEEIPEEMFVRVATSGIIRGELYNVRYYLNEGKADEYVELLNKFGYGQRTEANRRILEEIGRPSSGTSGKERKTGTGVQNLDQGEDRELQEATRRERKERLAELFNRVADTGLQGVLGNETYDRMMMDIYSALPEDARKEIIEDAFKNYGATDFIPAVSDYIGAKADGSLWDKIVTIVREALRKVGFDLDLNANEVRYLAWRSQKPLDRNNVLEVAEDIDMKNRLKVGEYDGTTPDGGGTRFRTSEDVLNQIKQARKEVEKNPSEAQKEAGNYKKGHISLDGFEITLENPKGGTRSGVDKNGKKWSITMNNDYGYIRGTEAVDGDHIDVFLSDNPTEGRVFVVDQSNEDGTFDESKVMYGFNSLDEARNAYLSNYEKGWEKRIMDITEVSKDEFKRWIDSSHKKTKAFSEYKNVKSGSNDIRFRVANKLNVRDEYEATIKKGGYQAREAVQDAMLSLRRFQELIEKASGKKLRDFENAWMHENRLSSTVQSEIHEMERKFYKPMINAVKKLMKVSGLKEEQVADYLMLKHGIERNREMAVRKALTDAEGKIDRAQLDAWYREKEAIRNDATLDTWRKKQEAMDNAALNYGADMSRDYSGLTSMFNTDDVSVAVTDAYNEVESIENAHQTEAENLGKAIKAMTQNTLDKAFSSGLMDRKVYDELSKDMYDYYIPLRGFEETTSDEVYAYMDNERNAFNAPLKRAKGRSSKADNPIAYLKSIAESGIMQGERNQMKQTFLNLVTNNPSDLVSVREGVWAMYNPATDEWEAVAPPQLPNNATPADVENAMEAWEQSMEQKAANNPDVKKISEADDVPYRVIGNRMNQHQVIVKRLGKSYTLTINGNPRLAMALNGMTNPNNRSNDGKAAAYVASKVDALNRSLAAWYTTRNPDFVASNFMRDTFYTNTIVRAKEGNHYANHFHKHYAKLLMPGKMIDLFRKYENGTLDLSKPMERDFHEFMMNGGETGYSNLKDLEDIKKQISKELKGSRLEDLKKVVEKFDILNRAVENTARFAAYRTSRQVGRSVARSIFDAKEISVNFNKKGSGGTFFGATGQTKFGNMAAMVGAGGRALYVFFNAAVQGTTNLLHVMKVNPKGTSAGLSAMFLMGAVLPYLFGGDDDEEKQYYDIPEHVRRNHLIIPGTGDAWVSIPLPIEYRIMYGMGELLTSWRTGHERGSDIARKMLNLTGQALPLNFLEEGLDAFMPSALSPIWQVYNNESWTGLPIYKDNEFNKDDPEYTKAYKNVDRNIYNFTKAMYEWTFDEENQKEGIDLNPAVIESLAKGYFGGMATQMSNIAKTYEMIAGEREFDWRSIPIGSRVFKTGDKRTKEKRITNEYFENMDKLEFLQSRERLLNRTKEGSAVPQEDKDKADNDLKVMKGSDVYQKYMEFKKAKKTADRIYKLRKTKDSPELEKDYYEALDKANKALN